MSPSFQPAPARANAQAPHTATLSLADERDRGPSDKGSIAAAPAQVLAFRAGNARFVVDVRRIVGVLGGHGLVSAKVGRADLDYLAWQGEAVPVLTLAALLADGTDETSADRGPRARVLLLRTARGLAGLKVDEAEQVCTLGPDACLQAEESRAQPSPWCLGLCRMRDELYGLFDVRALAEHLP